MWPMRMSNGPNVRIGARTPDPPRLVSGPAHLSQGVTPKTKYFPMVHGSSPDCKPLDATSPKHRPCWHCGKYVAVYRGQGHYCSAGLTLVAIAAMAEETDRRPTSVAAASEQAATGERLRQSETGRAEGGNLLVQVRAT